MSNSGGVYTWNKTATSNASADTTVNWSEGQAPSSINDSARAMMASVAKYRDDISGAIVTTGISVAYIVASNQVFDSLADFAGQVIAFTPHVTNAAGPVTVTVDGFANIPLRSSPGKELMAGVLIAGTPYVATYNNTDGALYLQGLFGNPFNVPLLGGMDYWDTIAPNSSFIFPMGQAISRTTYATAFARWGTKFGPGDGSTTFNVPDKTGRVSAMMEAVATRLTTAGGGVDGGTLGANGGGQNQTLTLAQLPTGITSAGSLSGPASGTISGSASGVLVSGSGSGVGGGGSFGVPGTGSVSGSFSGTASVSGTVTSNNTSGNAHTIMQPTIVCNYIIRII
jgi:microcystin-dependent protein